MLLALGLGYYIVCEAATGATLGKRMVGIRVVGEDGDHVTFGAAVVRNLVRLVDALLLLAAKQEGKLKLTIAECDIGAVIAQLEPIWGPALRSSDLHLIVTAPAHCVIPAERPDHLAGLLNLARVQPGRGLVQQEDFRVAEQRLGKPQPLPIKRGSVLGMSLPLLGLLTGRAQAAVQPTIRRSRKATTLLIRSGTRSARRVRDRQST